jgi:dTDP-4-amino-4,6-dideoxygalactose transaminase
MFDGQQSFPNAARAEQEVLHLPAYPEMSEADVDRVAKAVDEALVEIGLDARTT